MVINTDEIKACPGTPCAHAIQHKGCGIYEQRPVNPCRNFKCAWVLGNSILPDWMKPSECKAIVTHGAIKWRGTVLDLVVPVGQKVPETTLAWLRQSANQRQVPFVFAEHFVENGVLTGGKRLSVYGPEPLRTELVKWLDAGNSLW